MIKVELMRMEYFHNSSLSKLTSTSLLSDDDDACDDEHILLDDCSNLDLVCAAN